MSTFHFSSKSHREKRCERRNKIRNKFARTQFFVVCSFLLSPSLPNFDLSLSPLSSHWMSLILSVLMLSYSCNQVNLTSIFFCRLELPWTEVKFLYFASTSLTKRQRQIRFYSDLSFGIQDTPHVGKSSKIFP